MGGRWCKVQRAWCRVRLRGARLLASALRGSLPTAALTDDADLVSVAQCERAGRDDPLAFIEAVRHFDAFRVLQARADFAEMHDAVVDDVDAALAFDIDDGVAWNRKRVVARTSRA